MVIVSCPAPGCTYKTEDLPIEAIVPLLNIHALEHSRPQIHASKGPKLNRPMVDVGIDEETWNSFVRRWETFKLGSGINDDAAPTQLFQCASEALGDLLLKSDPRLTLKSTETVLIIMKSLAVIPVARGVNRAELFQMSQSNDEPIRTFAARVRGKAETCSFTTKCKCGHDAEYTEEVIRDVLLAGIADVDIRRDALSMPGILDKTTNDVIAIIETREMARNATPMSSLSAVSSYKREKNTKSELPKTSPCPTCSKPFLRFRERQNGGMNKVPYKLCLDCWRADKKKQQSQKESQPGQPGGVKAITTEEQITQVSAINNNRTHPKTTIHIGFAGQAETHIAPVEVVADTGAMSNVWGLTDFVDAGFSVKDLHPSSAKIRSVNEQSMDIVGQFKGLFRGLTPTKELIECTAIVYVSNSVRGFYLSYDTMKNLYIVGNDFPTIGSCMILDANKDKKPYLNAHPHANKVDKDNISIRSISSGCAHPNNDTVTCECPQRTAVPSRPQSLPFPAIPENNDKMRQWLLDRYASSTFNTCPHRALPCMSGPPMEIHIEESAVPKVCNKPAPVPLHWQQRVYDDLLRDEALGVIERVPDGVPVTWCHRMVVTRKHDGTPRRTVDLSPLNKFCKRETFPAEAPFHLARRVPGKTWKTVTDAWNGYHSVPLRESDRHLTTFITPFGRWRYTRAPQGFLSSGDGYNQRFDAILTDFVRKERCVDDTIHYDGDLETHWWRTIDLLTLTGASGSVMNPEKFQFAQREADFAGFRIAETSIEPLPKYIDAIKSFPTPKSTRDVRSWFGLVNQVSNYAQLRDFMAIFRPFLSPKYKFFWSEVLDKEFEQSKKLIIESIREGVQIFDMSKPTCLRPDWSSCGIGYFLLQKHCSCASNLPDCCPDGWKITLAGSRFLSGAEERYAAIEGEALAIAWGLEQTKYFTQGCKDLTVVTDHKPLVKIFGDRTLDEIANTRLFRLKQRTLPWHFHIEHLPGKTNLAADAASRYPASDDVEVSTMTVGDQSEYIITAGISKEVEDVTTVSWALLAEETGKDVVLSKLMEAISEGFSNDHKELSDYMRYRDSLYTSDGVVLYQDRAVIPSSLRRTILEGLHSAHQGVSSMQSRAQSIVFWPGMTLDIQETRSKCRECNRNAPSQAPMPSIQSTPPLTPFEQIFADFFEYGGHHYLITGDRLSGWTEVFSTPTGSVWSGARGLIACLRSSFATFGVPDELSSDGGPEFAAGVTKNFLETWDVKHRKSAAYNPQSNGRAEVAVKSAKRLLMSNIGPNGSLNSDKFIRALLQLRNTPDPDCNLSPAQIIFGRPIRDSLSFVNRLEKFSNPHVRPMWREAWAKKESALRTRFTRSSEALNEHAKQLQPLSIGEKCFIQNQTGNFPTKWHRTGTVVEVCNHDQYVLKVDGSGRLTKRNRRFLRSFKPASLAIDNAPLSNTAQAHKRPEIFPVNSDVEERSTPFPPPMLVPSESLDINEEPCPANVPDSEAPPTTPCISNTLANQPPEGEKVPAMLKRILPFNSQGRCEDTVPPEDGGRRTRRRAFNI